MPRKAPPRAPSFGALPGALCAITIDSDAPTHRPAETIAARLAALDATGMQAAIATMPPARRLLLLDGLKLAEAHLQARVDQVGAIRERIKLILNAMPDPPAAATAINGEGDHHAHSKA